MSIERSEHQPRFQAEKVEDKWRQRLETRVVGTFLSWSSLPYQTLSSKREKGPSSPRVMFALFVPICTRERRRGGKRSDVLRPRSLWSSRAQAREKHELRKTSVEQTETTIFLTLVSLSPPRKPLAFLFCSQSPTATREGAAPTAAGSGSAASSASTTSGTRPRSSAASPAAPRTGSPRRRTGRCAFPAAAAAVAAAEAEAAAAATEATSRLSFATTRPRSTPRRRSSGAGPRPRRPPPAAARPGRSRRRAPRASRRSRRAACRRQRPAGPWSAPSRP